MTKAMFTGLLAALVLAVTTVLPVRAADAEAKTKTGQPFVVLVGISDYEDQQITPRPHAEEDVKALYDLFTNKDYLGVDAAHTRLLLGKEDAGRKSQPATKENILKALEWVKDEAKPDDLVIFGYFGEGGSLGERGDRRCYFAKDSTLKDRDKNAVAAAQIGEILDKLKSQHFCALIDVNFKGFSAKDAKESVPEPDLRDGKNFYREFLGDDGSEDHVAVPGRAVFLATMGLTPALDLEKHDVFAQLVLDGLKGAADKDGHEADGLVTVDELMEYLDKELPEQLRQHGKTAAEKESTHLVLGGRASHFALTHNPAAYAKAQERLDKLAEMAKAKKISSELAEEGANLLRQMPKLEAMRSLRKEYQKLVDGTGDLAQFSDARAKILKSQKLAREIADAFAKKVIKVTQLIGDNYVKEVKQGELINWAVRGLYRRLDEKVPQEVLDKLAKTKNMSEAELTELLADVRERLGKREDLDNHKDLDIALQRMMSHLDPYTTYIDPETANKVDIDIKGTFTGVGIQIRKDSARDMLQVVTPIKGSPAFKAGIQTGDIITTVTREMDSEGKKLDPPEVFSTKGISTNDIVKKILGKPGTKVKLTVEREGVDKPLEFELTRGLIETESVMGYKRKTDADWDYYVDPENKIAYVRLTSFAHNTARDLAKVMRALDKEQIKGLVLDLRFNPGGYLTSATEISDLFIDDGLIVTIKPRVGREQTYFGHHAGSYLGFPMVCMVNGGSASGSEIVSACLQDHKRAVIVGERSYGKGSVQNITPDEEGGELKMTIASFWRPNGKNLNKSSTKGTEDEDWGVRPDNGYLVELSRKDRDDLAEHQRNAEIIQRPDRPSKEKAEFKDVQLDKALEYLRGQIKTAAKTSPKKEG